MNKILRLLFIFTTLSIILSCGLGKAVKNAETALQAKQYAVAIDYLTEDYDNSSSKVQRAKISFQLAETYYKLRELADAKKWYKRSNSLGNGVPSILGLIKTSKGLEQYDEAIGYINELRKEKYSDQFIRDEIRFCQEAKRIIADFDNNINLEISKFSSRSADYSPTFYDDNFIVFASSREDAIGSNIYNWTGYDFSDLFIVGKNSNRKAKNFDVFINTEANEGTICFNKDWSQLIFTRCPSNDPSKDSFCKLYRSYLIDSYWSEPEELNFIKPGYNYGHPTFFDNDSVLIFSSDLDIGFGGHDLYYSELLENDLWSMPFPLPSKINTEGNEMFPTVDGDTLYFSSDKLAGLGGLDIFKTFLNREDNVWQLPEHLRAPINSGSDDFGLIVDRSESNSKILKGFFTSSRKGLGDDDIYYFEKSEPSFTKPKVPIEKADTSEIVEQDLYVIVKVYTNILSDENDPNSAVLGKKYLPSVNLKLIRSGSDTTKIVTDENGASFSEISLGNKYKLIGSLKDYLSNSLTFDTKEIAFLKDETSKTINYELKLDKIYLNKEIVLENIYYDFNKWEIREDAKPTLDTLALLLQENPQINIELSSHTDCRGEDAYNLELSQKRAESAVDYLINTGISELRIVPVGYGETLPAVSCLCADCSDAQHQKNRRTSFIIRE